MRSEYEVIVIGGGPAGSTCATLLAQHGHDVLLLEKEHFPRFHIGESLMPLTYGPLKRIGVLEKLRAGNFVKKESVQFINASGKMSQPFYFKQTHPHESSQTWQVLRSEFDQMLLENAREKGVTAIEGAAVTDVLFEGMRAVGVKVRLPADNSEGRVQNAESHTLKTSGGVQSSELKGSNGEPAPGGSPDGGAGTVATIRAKVVVDATGTNAILSRKLHIRRKDPKLRKAAVFAHYKGAYRDTGVDEGATLVVSVTEGRGWFWSIPLPDDITSVGVVAEPEYLFQNRPRDPEKILAEEIDRCVGIKPRMANAVRVGPVHVLSDFSYAATQCAGEGWVLIGDAFGFLDPIYSSGVFLALSSAELAADAIHDGLVSGDLTGRTLGRWGDEFYRGMQAMRKLVYAFYTEGFSFGEFIRKHPDTLKDLVGLLIGDLYTPAVENVFRPMREFIELPEALALDQPAANPAVCA